MMPRRSFSPRRRKTWNSILGLRAALGLSITVVGGGLSFPESGFTVLRMFGEYMFTPDASDVPVAGESAALAVGIGVISTEAFLAGVTPDPIGESEYPWLYWADHSVVYESTALDPSTPAMSARIPFEVSSMRKIAARETLFMCVEFGIGAGASATLFEMSQTRVLLALP